VCLLFIRPEHEVTLTTVFVLSNIRTLLFVDAVSNVCVLEECVRDTAELIKRERERERENEGV